MNIFRRPATTTIALARRMAHQADEHDGGLRLWRNLSLFVAIPSCIIMGAYNYMVMMNEPHERPEFIPYDHLRIRNKRFPWGDGQRTLFHNPHVNPLPTGYEDEGHGHH